MRQMHRLRPRLTYANVVSTICLFVVLGGGAYAATNAFVGPGGKIHGCVSKKRKLTVLKTAESTCPTGTTAIAWNQTGPAGTPGAKGDTGPPGPSTGAASGDLMGNYPGPTIAPNAVNGAKVGDGSLTGADVHSDSLTGTQIDESSLAQVPDAAKLNGLPAGDYKQFTHANSVATSDCVTQIQLWTGCAPISITVPNGKLYAITVTSTVNADSTATQTAGLCAASAGPTCMYFNGAPELTTFWGGAYTTGVSSATEYVGGPQTFVAQTAVKLGGALNATPNAKTTTQVVFYDVSAEHP